MPGLARGFVIEGPKGENLSETGFWWNHKRDGTEPFVHPPEVLEAIRSGGTRDWPISPSMAIPAEYDPDQLEGKRVRLLGAPEPIKVTPGDGESYVRAVTRMAELLRGEQTPARSDDYPPPGLPDSLERCLRTHESTDLPPRFVDYVLQHLQAGFPIASDRQVRLILGSLADSDASLADIQRCGETAEAALSTQKDPRVVAFYEMLRGGLENLAQSIKDSSL